MNARHIPEDTKLKVPLATRGLGRCVNSPRGHRSLFGKGGIPNPASMKSWLSTGTDRGGDSVKYKNEWSWLVVHKYIMPLFQTLHGTHGMNSKV